MFAQGADDVIGQGVTLVDPAADTADIALFALGVGLGLNVLASHLAFEDAGLRLGYGRYRESS